MALSSGTSRRDRLQMHRTDRYQMHRNMQSARWYALKTLLHQRLAVVQEQGKNQMSRRVLVRTVPTWHSSILLLTLVIRQQLTWKVVMMRRQPHWHPRHQTSNIQSSPPAQPPTVATLFLAGSSHTVRLICGSFCTSLFQLPHSAVGDGKLQGFPGTVVGC